MSRGAHAGPRKHRRRVGERTRVVALVLGGLVGLAACAAVGWTVVALTIRVGVLAGTGALIAVVVVVALTWLTISRRRTPASASSRR